MNNKMLWPHDTDSPLVPKYLNGLKASDFDSEEKYKEVWTLGKVLTLISV